MLGLHSSPRAVLALCLALMAYLISPSGGSRGLWIGIPVARGQSIDVKLDCAAVKPGKKSKSKKDNDSESEDKGPPPPVFEATISGAVPGLEKDQFELQELDAEPAVMVTATEVKPYIKSDDKLAMVVLVQGSGRWMGNETYAEEEEGEEPLTGAFSAIPSAVDELAKAGPPGSQAALLVYANGKAIEKQAMDDATKLSGSSLGSQKDYEDVLDSPLLAGLSEATNLLDGFGRFRRVLVVIGDGTGEREDISTDLQDAVGKLQQRKIEVFSIFYEGVESGSPAGQSNMKSLGYTDSHAASSKENFASFAQKIVTEIGKRYYVTFPVCTDTQPAQCITTDGNVLEFVVLIDGEETDPVETKTCLWDKPKEEEEGGWGWLLLLLIPVVAVVCIIFLVIRASSSQPAPPPPFPMEMPPPMEEPPMPVKAKTVMLSIGGSADGPPIVGWLVPLDGPNQYQTFKLDTGSTKIGTGDPCQIIIGDSYMSTTHAEIISSPDGYVLKDLGSTNGTYVRNDERLTAEHQLFDNDRFRLGQTNFKFKTIN